MKQVNLIGITPEELQSSILEGVKTLLQEFKKNFEPKTPNEYLGRSEVAKILKVKLSTVHNYTVKNILTAHQIGRRVLYKRSEVESAIIQLKK
jgi:excisionase family DNA binding protein